MIDVLAGLQRHPEVRRLGLTVDTGNAWNICHVLTQLLPIDNSVKYELLGISSAMGSHRMAWALNRAFGWRMECADDVVSVPSKKEATAHPALRFVDEDGGTSVTLILNRIPDGMLAPGASGLDSLLVVHHLDMPPHELIVALRSLKEVAFVTALDPEGSGALESLMALD